MPTRSAHSSIVRRFGALLACLLWLAGFEIVPQLHTAFHDEAGHHHHDGAHGHHRSLSAADDRHGHARDDAHDHDHDHHHDDASEPHEHGDERSHSRDAEVWADRIAEAEAGSHRHGEHHPELARRIALGGHDDTAAHHLRGAAAGDHHRDAARHDHDAHDHDAHDHDARHEHDAASHDQDALHEHGATTNAQLAVVHGRDTALDHHAAVHDHALGHHAAFETGHELGDHIAMVEHVALGEHATRDAPVHEHANDGHNRGARYHHDAAPHDRVADAPSRDRGEWLAQRRAVVDSSCELRFAAGADPACASPPHAPAPSQALLIAGRDPGSQTSSAELRCASDDGHGAHALAHRGVVAVSTPPAWPPVDAAAFRLLARPRVGPQHVPAPQWRRVRVRGPPAVVHTA